jgi:hypothetical protein
VVRAGGGATVVVGPAGVVVVGAALGVVVGVGRALVVVGCVVGGGAVVDVTGGRPDAAWPEPLLVNAKTPSPTATTATPIKMKPAVRTGRDPCMLTADRNPIVGPRGCAGEPNAAAAGV